MNPQDVQNASHPGAQNMDGEREVYPGVYNFLSNDDINVKAQLGMYSVVEYKRDLSVTPETAQNEWFMANMNIRRRQLVIAFDQGDSAILQAGAMQWMLGSVESTTGIKGAGDLIGKMFKGAVSGESAVKPEYVAKNGKGMLVCEPTYKHLILVDLNKWNNAIVVEDGMFLSAQGGTRLDIVARSNVSSAVAGGEGLFNLCMRGNGVVALESSAPYEELVEIELNNDVIKIDGSYAVAWSDSLQFTVERSGKTLIGSAASGEGLVNVYRGTGRILMRPI